MLDDPYAGGTSMPAAYTHPDPASIIPFCPKPMTLIVEDEITVAAYLSDMLEELGFHIAIAIATTAKSAMQLAHAHKFEVASIEEEDTFGTADQLVALRYC